MPFLRRRILENCILFTLMGIVYYFLYRNVVLPDSKYALAISYGGVLVVTMFLYVYLLYKYLMNVAEMRAYVEVNVAAYVVYMVVFYIFHVLNILVGGIFESIHKIVFMPYDVFTFLGIGSTFSSVLVHIIYLAAISIAPNMIRRTSNPADEYFSSLRED